MTRSEITPDALQQSLAAWVAARGFTALKWSCALNAAPDPVDDYDCAIRMNCTFEPEPGGARVWLHLLDTGFVGIGVETRGELAKRAGMRSDSPVYAAGALAAQIDIREVLSILGDVAAGAMVFWVSRTPFGVAVRTISQSSGAPYGWDVMSNGTFWPWGWKPVKPQPWR